MLLSRASGEGSPWHEIYSKAVDQLPAASDLESSSAESCRASGSFFQQEVPMGGGSMINWGGGAVSRSPTVARGDARVHMGVY